MQLYVKAIYAALVAGVDYWVNMLVNPTNPE